MIPFFSSFAAYLIHWKPHMKLSASIMQRLTIAPLFLRSRLDKSDEDGSDRKGGGDMEAKEEKPNRLWNVNEMQKQKIPRNITRKSNKQNCLYIKTPCNYDVIWSLLHSVEPFFSDDNALLRTRLSYSFTLHKSMLRSVYLQLCMQLRPVITVSAYRSSNPAASSLNGTKALTQVSGFLIKFIFCHFPECLLTICGKKKSQTHAWL